MRAAWHSAGPEGALWPADPEYVRWPPFTALAQDPKRKVRFVHQFLANRVRQPILSPALVDRAFPRPFDPCGRRHGRSGATRKGCR